MKLKKHHTLFCLAIVTTLFANPLSADTIAIATNGITDFFGNQNAIADAADASGLLFDEARTGGGDSAAAMNFNPARSLVGVAGANDNWADGLAVGSSATIAFSGIGVALRGGTTATTARINIVYLGADGAANTADDEVVGSVEDSLNFTGTGEYAWAFDNELQFNWDGANDRFRFELTGLDGNLRFKQRSANESPSGQGGLTMSVGGRVITIPEPSAAFAIFGAFLSVSMVRRRH